VAIHSGDHGFWEDCVPISLNRAARGRLHRIVLVRSATVSSAQVSKALVGLALIGTALVGTAGGAGAQDVTEDSSTATTTSVIETPTDDSPATPQNPLTPPAESAESTGSTGSAGSSGSTGPTGSTESSPRTTQAEKSAPLSPFDVSVLTDCWPDGFGEVTVFLRIPENSGVKYSVSLPGHDTEVASYNPDVGSYVVGFTDVAAGIHSVTVTGTDGTHITADANLENCRPTDQRPDDQLKVSVTCRDGLGVVTIQVYNPDTQKASLLTITVDDAALPPYEDFVFFPDVVAKITELGEDGTYEIKLLDGGTLVDSETITIACAPTATTPSTAPPPQGGTLPSDGPSDGLPTTGAAVRGVAVLGVVALLLGAALVLVGQRRRATAATAEESEA
jgi:hypothetical protein